MSTREREYERKSVRQPEAAELGAATSTDCTSEIGPEDFYYEGPYLVFTAAYHLKRGFCCNSNCRHCPYK